MNVCSSHRNQIEHYILWLHEFFSTFCVNAVMISGFFGEMYPDILSFTWIIMKPQRISYLLSKISWPLLSLPPLGMTLMVSEIYEQASVLRKEGEKLQSFITWLVQFLLRIKVLHINNHKLNLKNVQENVPCSLNC